MVFKLFKFPRTTTEADIIRDGDGTLYCFTDAGGIAEQQIAYLSLP